jgi:hypothetical protein
MEIGEKLDRLAVPLVCRIMAAFKVGTTFLLKPSRKTLGDLCESGRG